jgi:hypothetical protein
MFLLTPIITFPEGFITDLLGYTGQLFTDLAPYLALILGVLLGAIVITLIIHAIKS